MQKPMTAALLAAVLVLLPVPVLHATELIYTPVNPAFGGNPLNATYLLGTAEAQNKSKAPKDDLFGSDPLDDFSTSLNRRILSILAGKIVDSAFGEEGLEPGRFELGDFVIDVIENANGGPVITITDLVSGNTTTIDIPSY